VIVEIPEEEVLTLPFDAFHLAPIPGRGITPGVPRWTTALEELLDGSGAKHARILCHGWDGPVPREEIEQRRRYIRDLWEGIERAAAEGLDYETARRRRSIDRPFAYVKEWDLWEEHGRDWVIEDHEGRMFPAYWRALHEDGAVAIAEAIAMNPENENGREMLRRLGAE